MKALFISFPAADYAASTHFYEAVVGLPVRRQHEGGPHRFTDYELGGLALKVFEWLEPWHGSGHSGLFIKTEEFDAAVERICRSGARRFDVVTHAWGGRCCTVADPFGNLFDLIDARQTGLG